MDKMRTMDKELYTQLRGTLVILRKIAIDKWWWSNDLHLPEILEKLEFDLLDFYDALEALGLSKKDKRRIDKALIYFCRLHDGQMRKRGDKPYFTHILRVASKVADILDKVQKNHEPELKNKAADIIISALAHDSVEDHAASIAGGSLIVKDVASERDKALYVVENKFGESVRHWVSVLSKPNWEDPRNKKRDYSQWVQYIWQDGDWVSTILKLSDILDNMEDTVSELETFEAQANSESKEILKIMKKLIEKYGIILVDLSENYDDYLANTILLQKNVKEYIQKDINNILYRTKKLLGLNPSADHNELKAALAKL